MPAKSKAQLRKMFVLEREGKVPKGTALEWAHATPDIKALPEHVSPKEGDKGGDEAKQAYALPELIAQVKVAAANMPTVMPRQPISLSQTPRAGNAAQGMAAPQPQSLVDAQGQPTQAPNQTQQPPPLPQTPPAAAQAGWRPSVVPQAMTVNNTTNQRLLPLVSMGGVAPAATQPQAAAQGSAQKAAYLLPRLIKRARRYSGSMLRPGFTAPSYTAPGYRPTGSTLGVPFAPSFGRPQQMQTAQQPMSVPGLFPSPMQQGQFPQPMQAPGQPMAQPGYRGGPGFQGFAGEEDPMLAYVKAEAETQAQLEELQREGGDPQKVQAMQRQLSQIRSARAVRQAGMDATNRYQQELRGRAGQDPFSRQEEAKDPQARYDNALNNFNQRATAQGKYQSYLDSRARAKADEAGAAFDREHPASSDPFTGHAEAWGRQMQRQQYQQQHGIYNLAEDPLLQAAANGGIVPGGPSPEEARQILSHSQWLNASGKTWAQHQGDWAEQQRRLQAGLPPAPPTPAPGPGAPTPTLAGQWTGQPFAPSGVGARPTSTTGAGAPPAAPPGAPAPAAAAPDNWSGVATGAPPGAPAPAAMAPAAMAPAAMALPGTTTTSGASTPHAGGGDTAPAAAPRMPYAGDTARHTLPPLGGAKAAGVTVQAHSLPPLIKRSDPENPVDVANRSLGQYYPGLEEQGAAQTQRVNALLQRAGQNSAPAGRPLPKPTSGSVQTHAQIMQMPAGAQRDEAEHGWYQRMGMSPPSRLSPLDQSEQGQLNRFTRREDVLRDLRGNDRFTSGNTPYQGAATERSWAVNEPRGGLLGIDKNPSQAPSRPAQPLQMPRMPSISAQGFAQPTQTTTQPQTLAAPSAFLYGSPSTPAASTPAASTPAASTPAASTPAQSLPPALRASTSRSAMPTTSAAGRGAMTQPRAAGVASQLPGRMPGVQLAGASKPGLQFKAPAEVAGEGKGSGGVQGDKSPGG